MLKNVAKRTNWDSNPEPQDRLQVAILRNAVMLFVLEYSGSFP